MGIMKEIIVSLIVAVIILFSNPSAGQFLSHLDATREDALFTTYAAPLNRSSYSNDQGYQFSWNDMENGAEFTSKDGLNFGLAFSSGTKVLYRLDELYQAPVITISYSDLVKYYYYPFKDIRIEVLFDVYSSQEAIADIRIRNEGAFPAEEVVMPYLYYPSGDTINDFKHQSPFDFYSFPVRKHQDNWMKEHSIPFTEDLLGFAAGDIRFDSTISFVIDKDNLPDHRNNDPIQQLKQRLIKNKKGSKAVKGLIFSRGFRIYPGDQVHFRMVFGVDE